jgi:phosphoribosyl-ATP pyrophosphohydrolase
MSDNLDNLMDLIQGIHIDNAYHIKRGFRVSESGSDFASTHLIEEAVEFHAALLFDKDRKNHIEEAADVLVCLLAALKYENIKVDDVLDVAIEKVRKIWTLDQSKITAKTRGLTRRGRAAIGV